MHDFCVFLGAVDLDMEMGMEMKISETNQDLANSGCYRG